MWQIIWFDNVFSVTTYIYIYIYLFIYLYDLNNSKHCPYILCILAYLQNVLLKLAWNWNWYFFAIGVKIITKVFVFYCCIEHKLFWSITKLVPLLTSQITFAATDQHKKRQGDRSCTNGVKHFSLRLRWLTITNV